MRPSIGQALALDASRQVLGRGGAFAITITAQALSWRFQTFDALVSGIESELPSIVKQYGFVQDVELLIAGWSRARNRPDSYVITFYR